MTTSKKHTILIVGATGIVGAAAIDHFASLPDWQVIAVSRRVPVLPSGVKHLALDLTDASACAAARTSLRPVTHVLFAALFELPDLVAGWRDARQMQVNLAMLRNLLDALEPAAKGLRHISLMQGTKAYGGHVEPAPVPAKERWPRHQHENFYWLQEDLLRQRQPHSAWTFTVLRPQLVFGFAVGSPMNIIAAIGAYAAIRRELGMPLAYPGGGRFVSAASDSRMIARAAEFAATHEIAANETYNVVNGDLLVWHDIWASIASRFGMASGPAESTELAKLMPAHETTWQRIVGKNHLQAQSLAELIGSSWQFADRSLAFGNANPADSILSTIKLRKHGFADCEDTEDSVHYWLDLMQQRRLLPR